MDSTILTSLVVSCIAISVIFTVLVILIYTIKLLVYLKPYEEPPAPKATGRALSKSTLSSGVSPEIISAITAVMSTHLGKSPQEFRITQINPE
ncbi:uncharacterized protein METZ01_LOCUS302328 [marine metagenome]|uniref:Oxaloacetate decarboxylase gamma chain n=1 Tax=marine metagenome TaxID=408172 RepID=A0A382MKH7_9ZZZZ